ncbi:unnamed protein product [Closterium sp. NIES-64]|nr:unnamed protein product [Closterium sp. NIES-64]
MNAVRVTKEKLPQLLMNLAATPSNAFNFDETALFISILTRRTYESVCTAGRKIAKQRLTVGFLVNADGSRLFRSLIISKARWPHDFRPDYNSEEYCYWRHNAKGWMTSTLFTHYVEQLGAAIYAEGRKIVVLLDNASSHALKTEGAMTEDMFGFRTVALGNIRLAYLPPNTTCFTQPLDQGLIAMAKARYCQHWLRAFTQAWSADGATSAAARFRPNMRAVVEWLNDAWMNIPVPNAVDIGLEVSGVGLLIDRLCLGSSAMAAEAFVGIDDNQPTCAKPGEDPLAWEPLASDAAAMWEAPANMQAVYDDSNPASREARRTARAACKMLIGYVRATYITPRDLCALLTFATRSSLREWSVQVPLLIATTSPPPPPPPPAVTHADTPPPETPRRRGRVLSAWMHVPTPDWVAQTVRRQELIEAGAPAVMSGYLAAVEWMRL